jgi:uncharacterized protein
MDKNRVFKAPDQSFFLFGSRGTGKSTLLSDLLPNALYIDLLLAQNYQRYAADPDRLLENARALDSGSAVVIDEVQRVPALLPVCHALIEERPDLLIVLSGSSTRKLRKVSSDLLGGRALMKELHPFMACELGDDFSLDRALAQGCLPVVFASKRPQETLEAYLGLYMIDEVKAEGITRNLDSFAKFLEVISFSHGEQVNVTEISRELGVSRTTVSSYIEILVDLLVAFELPVFSARVKRAVVASKKFYYFDTGVFQAIRPRGVLEDKSTVVGAALEGLVAQHLRAWIAYSLKPAKLSFWRTRTGSEVDFVLYGEDVFVAMEVKNTMSVRRSDLRGLKSFRQDYPEAKLVFLYRGDEDSVIDGIRCRSVERFLRELEPGKPIA